ncbi:MAG: hypothetical protein ACXVRP_14800 [Solirubrobacteraceae bacterium]
MAGRHEREGQRQQRAPHWSGLEEVLDEPGLRQLLSSTPPSSGRPDRRRPNSAAAASAAATAPAEVPPALANLYRLEISSTAPG